MGCFCENEFGRKFRNYFFKLAANVQNNQGAVAYFGGALVDFRDYEIANPCC